MSMNPICVGVFCNSLINMLYLVGITVAGLLTLIAMTTPGWRQTQSFSSSSSSSSNNGLMGASPADYWSAARQSFGIVAGQCNGTSCVDYFQVSQPDWKKGVLASMILAILCCMAGFIWSFLACFACCCTSFLVSPLPVCAALACILDIIAVAVYAVKSGQSDGTSAQSTTESHADVGYSFWVGVSAIVVLIIDVIIGVYCVKIGKITPA